MSELHWSDTPEWKAYKSKQAELEQQLRGQQGSNVRGVGTITTMPVRPRSRTTHDLQMEACQVEWVDPNPPAPAEEILPHEAHEYEAEQNAVTPVIDFGGAFTLVPEPAKTFEEQRSIASPLVTDEEIHEAREEAAMEPDGQAG